ncbi:MAG: glycosyltransferase [Pseudomonadota bacterium]
MKATRIKVSVIIPTYNRADLLPRAIKSVLRQTRPDFELLIIDDASTDETEAVVRSFEDDRVRYIKRTINHLKMFRKTGEADNPRNDGLKQARGRYISYLDSDDMYRSDFLEEMTRFLDERPGIDLAYSDYIWHRNLDGIKEEANCNMSVDFGPKIMEHRNIIGIMTVMHKREVVDKVGYFRPVYAKSPHPGIPYVGIEDWDYWLRVSQRFTIKHHSVILSDHFDQSSLHYHDPDFDPELEAAGDKLKDRLLERTNIFFQARSVQEFLDLAEKLQDVEGHLFPQEGYILYLLAKSGAGQGDIVEIGSFMGLSTSWLALGVKDGGRDDKVFAVDHHQGSKEHRAGRKHECRVLVDEGTTFNRFKKNIAATGAADRVEALVMTSSEAAAGWDKPIRLLFIDGDHGYESTKNDFETWAPAVVPGGYVVFHDVDSWPGVTRFFHELMGGDQDFRRVLSVKSMRVLKRNP